jgi:hypothetical protein
LNDKQKIIEAILKDQLELLRLALFAATQGPVVFAGERLVCNLSDAKVRTSQQIVMAAGQSVNTLLTCARWRGIPVRDLYPIARSAVESFINAAFILAEQEEVAERAVRWVRYRSWKHFNRTVGRGEFSLQIATSPGATAPPEFAEFTSKGASKEWSTVDAPERVRRVGNAAGKKAGSRLLAAYALNYAISSEVIHGSPFGVNYFYQAHVKQPTVDGFMQATGEQVEEILIAVSHAFAGYLATFFALQSMDAPYVAEQKIFNRLLSLDGVAPQEVESTDARKPV